MKTLKQPIEGSMEVGPYDEIVFTMSVHGAEYLAEATDFAVMADGSTSMGFYVRESHYACKRCWRTVE